MAGFMSFSNSTCKRVLNLWKMGYLRLREAVVKRIIVIKFGENDEGGNGTVCCSTKVMMDTAKLANMITARFRERDEIWSQKVRNSSKIKDEAKAASRVGGVEQGVVYFGQLFLSPMSGNSVLEKSTVKRFAVIREEMC